MLAALVVALVATAGQTTEKEKWEETSLADKRRGAVAGGFQAPRATHKGRRLRKMQEKVEAEGLLDNTLLKMKRKNSKDKAAPAKAKSVPKDQLARAAKLHAKKNMAEGDTTKTSAVRAMKLAAMANKRPVAGVVKRATRMEKTLQQLNPHSSHWSHQHVVLRTMGDALAFDSTKGLLFIHVPKAGGTSIELALKHVGALSTNYTIGLECKRPMLTMAAENLNAAHIVESMAVAAIRDCHGYTRPLRTFAVLREPAARLFSSYRWLRQRREERPRGGNFSSWLRNTDDPHLFKMRQTDFLGPCTMLFALESGEVWDFLKAEYPAIQPIQVQSNAVLGALDPVSKGQRRRSKLKAPAKSELGEELKEIEPELREWIGKRYADDHALWAGLMARAKEANGWRKAIPSGCASA